MLRTTVGALLLIAAGSDAYRLAPARQLASTPARLHRFRTPLCTIGDTTEEPAAEEPAAKTVVAATAEQVALTERASDPFRVVRVVLYVTFGITGLAGVVLSLLKMGSDPNALADVGINAAVVAGGVGIFLFDQSVAAKLKEKAEAELSNPYLKGDLLKTDDDDDE